MHKLKSLLVSIGSLVFIILILSACNNGSNDIIVDRYPDNTIRQQKVYEVVEGDTVSFTDIYFFHNGQKRLQGTFNNDLFFDGIWTFWNEDGIKVCEGVFSKGHRGGDWQGFQVISQ